MSCFFSCHSFFPKCLPLTRVFFFTYAPGQIYSPFKLSSNTSSTWKTFPFWKHSLGLASCIIRVIFVSFIEHIIWLWFFKFMMFYLQDEYRYIVCQRMCVCGGGVYLCLTHRSQLIHVCEIETRRKRGEGKYYYCQIIKMLLNHRIGKNSHFP